MTLMGSRQDLSKNLHTGIFSDYVSTRCNLNLQRCSLSISRTVLYVQYFGSGLRSPIQSFVHWLVGSSIELLVLAHMHPYMMWGACGGAMSMKLGGDSSVRGELSGVKNE